MLRVSGRRNCTSRPPSHSQKSSSFATSGGRGKRERQIGFFHGQTPLAFIPKPSKESPGRTSDQSPSAVTRHRGRDCNQKDERRSTLAYPSAVRLTPLTPTSANSNVQSIFFPSGRRAIRRWSLSFSWKTVTSFRHPQRRSQDHQSETRLRCPKLHTRSVGCPSISSPLNQAP
jgi:hypothetical protein